MVSLRAMSSSSRVMFVLWLLISLLAGTPRAVTARRQQQDGRTTAAPTASPPSSSSCPLDCQNGGTCQVVTETSDFSHYACACPHHTTGNLCETVTHAGGNHAGLPTTSWPSTQHLNNSDGNEDGLAKRTVIVLLAVAILAMAVSLVAKTRQQHGRRKRLRERQQACGCCCPGDASCTHNNGIQCVTIVRVPEVESQEESDNEKQDDSPVDPEEREMPDVV